MGKFIECAQGFGENGKYLARMAWKVGITCKIDDLWEKLNKLIWKNVEIDYYGKCSENSLFMESINLKSYKIDNLWKYIVYE